VNAFKDAQEMLVAKSPCYVSGRVDQTLKWFTLGGAAVEWRRLDDGGRWREVVVVGGINVLDRRA
jgi:hypothetical protein